ncbi:MAG: hypothetical protein WBE26_11680 [Phycisphaerae bacterium]
MAPARPEFTKPTAAVAGEGQIGPDIIVADLQSVFRFGRVGDITAYAVGTNACNLGDERARWWARTRWHPLISQAMYRLRNGRFEQIGMSWVKHGFYAVSESLCGPCYDPTDGSELGVGCSDPYSARLNGVQANMSRRSDVNAHTGFFPYPPIWGEWQEVIDKRLQVHDADLNPDWNTGALYFVQGHYVAADDSLAGNNNNSVCYRRVIVTEPSENEYEINVTDQAQRGQPAIRAWQDTDPSVVETDVQVPGEGLFILAAKATSLGLGFWQYEYAVENLNSDRSCGSVSVLLPDGIIVGGIAFHDVDYHSGEIYDLTDWPATVVDGEITWATTSYDENPYANALRWGTLYNFRFQTDISPGATTVTLGLFKPGQPTQVRVRTIGPEGGLIDCNGNGVADACDIDCDAYGCEAPCGLSADCNSNSVPDECDTASGVSEDLDDNGVPDECELPGTGDFDADRDVDLEDFKQLMGLCFDGPAIPSDFPCHVADFDGDGDVDLLDFAEFLKAFTVP